VNTPVVQRIWSTAKPYTSDGPGVTLWSQPRTGDSREEWEGILEDIENHHGSPSQEPPFTSLKVIGAKLDENARAALLAYGYKQLSETSTGFEASPGTSV
jgi:hypothetical protein